MTPTAVNSGRPPCFKFTTASIILTSDRILYLTKKTKQRNNDLPMRGAHLFEGTQASRRCKIVPQLRANPSHTIWESAKINQSRDSCDNGTAIYCPTPREMPVYRLPRPISSTSQRSHHCPLQLRGLELSRSCNQCVVVDTTRPNGRQCSLASSPRSFASCSSTKEQTSLVWMRFSFTSF